MHWKWTDHWVQPKSARELMSMVGSIGVYDTGQRFAWRGMSSADFELESSLHRSTGGDESVVRAAEEEIIRNAREWGLGTHPTGRVDDLQLLSDLQHFGVPTRLIDMSSNPMTALWFACLSAPPGKAQAGLLLALNVTGWGRLTTVPPAGASYEHQDDPEGAQLKSLLRQNSPHVIESVAPNARLRAQEGFFIAGSVPPDPPPGALRFVTPFRSVKVDWKAGGQPELQRRLLNPDAGRPKKLPFVAIVIDAALKSKLLQYLEGTYNRSSRVLFPDYQGYAKYVEDAIL